MKRFLGPEGTLARHIPDFEFRPHQLDLGEDVARVLCEHGVLLAEAGTGTGKSLAYLLPAIHCGKKVAISTGTKALQDQLFQKEIPFLREHLGSPFRACCLKGRGNYLCLRRLDSFRQQPLFDTAEEGRCFTEVLHWHSGSASGDREELTNLPENLDFWSRICSKSELCTGGKCEHQSRCFVQRARQRAAEADILVINHHLFFADLVIKERAYLGALPDCEAIIFDEAHLLEDVASEFLGAAVSNYGLEDLIQDYRLEVLGRLSRGKQAAFAEEMESVHGIGAELFASFSEGEEIGVLLPGALPRSVYELSERLRAALTELCASLTAEAAGLDNTPNLAPRTKELTDSLAFILNASDPEFVFWQEKRGKGRVLHASPLDISREFRTKVIDRFRAVVLTSATLSTDGDFEFIKDRLGVESCVERIFPSHFNFQEQTLLYVPPGLPLPDSPSFPERAADAVLALLLATRGRAFVLCTSLKNMRLIHERLEDRLPYQLMMQGDLPRSELLRRFRADVNSVLVATSSFWHGVDVKGEALSCVVVDRLPFAVPSNPLEAARIERLKKDGRNPFQDYQVPSAIIMLKQGFGRLIRNSTDRGVLAILDTRILDKGYGRRFLQSLPRMPLTREIRDVERFST